MPDSHPQPSHSSSSSGAASSGRYEGADLLLCGARLTDGRTVDVRLSGGRIEAVGTAGSLAVGGTRACGARVDLSGYLLLPAPAEPHAHGDTALSADVEGPVSFDPREVQRRATEAALLQLGHGATALRAHVRVGDVQGLGALAAVLQARRSLRGLAELTAVAMPRVLTGVAGAEGLAVLRDALKMGASVVGGCPDLDPDPTGYAEAILEVASEHGCPVDLHTDATDPARLARLAAMAGGLRPGVTLSPCAGLDHLPAEVVSRTADQLAAAGVAVVCLPQGGCAGVDRRGTAPVRLLRAAGVRVAAGSGALRDACNPVGRGGTRWRPRTCSPRGTGCGPRTPTTPSARRRGPYSGCPRSAWRRVSRPNCSRYVATAWPAPSPWRTAGSWCTGGAWWHGRARCASTATRRRQRSWGCLGRGGGKCRSGCGRLCGARGTVRVAGRTQRPAQAVCSR
ncbi:cytosine deaminase [Streptomyces sp. SAI-119]|nr:cytosine deaminase [Streptomyces sp. SAI-119]